MNDDVSKKLGWITVERSTNGRTWVPVTVHPHSIVANGVRRYGRYTDGFGNEYRAVQP